MDVGVDVACWVGGRFNVYGADCIGPSVFGEGMGKDGKVKEETVEDVDQTGYDGKRLPIKEEGFEGRSPPRMASRVEISCFWEWLHFSFPSVGGSD